MRQDHIGCIVVAAILGILLGISTWGGGLVDFISWALDPPTSHTVGPEVFLNNRISYVPLTSGVWIIKDEFSGEEYLAVKYAGLVKLERRAER